MNERIKKVPNNVMHLQLNSPKTTLYTYNKIVPKQRHAFTTKQSQNIYMHLKQNRLKTTIYIYNETVPKQVHTVTTK